MLFNHSLSDFFLCVIIDMGDKMKYIDVGKIVNTHGIKGELKIDSYSDLDRFSKGKVLYVGKDLIEVKIRSNRSDKGFEYVYLVGYDDINQVLPFKGQLVQIKETELGNREEDEFFFSELKGLEVYNEQGEYRGKVVWIRDVPQGQLLEVDTGKRIALIPFRKEFVLDVSDKIIIHEIEGLI